MGRRCSEILSLFISSGYWCLMGFDYCSVSVVDGCLLVCMCLGALVVLSIILGDVGGTGAMSVLINLGDSTGIGSMGVVTTLGSSVDTGGGVSHLRICASCMYTLVTFEPYCNDGTLRFGSYNIVRKYVAVCLR